MKTHLAALTGLLFSISANADVVATFTKQQANSDVLTVSIANEQSTNPHCRGKEARAVTSSGGMDFQLANGCWSVEGKDFISVEMYAYSDGREISFPIKMQDLQLTPKFAAMFASFNPELVRAVAATDSNDDDKPSITDAFAAGSCVMVQQALDDAKTQQEKAFAGKLRATLATSLQLREAELNDYCFKMLAATKALADAEE